MYTNSIILSGAYLLSVGGMLGWVFCSRQNKVPLHRKTVQTVVVRFALIYMVIFAVCELASISAWIPMQIVGFLFLFLALGLVWNEFILCLGSALLLYAIQQYVLGFPDRKRGEPAGSEMADSSKLLDKYIGKQGVAVSTLKPAGEVEIAGEKILATSESSDFIEVGTVVVVCHVRNGSLLVRVN